VLLAGPQRGYGKRVLLKHRNGVTTLYAHLDTIGVERGQAVRGGAPIGTVGRTSDAIGGTSRALGGFGNGMSSHLHFSVHRGLPTANMSSAVERLRGTEPSAWCGAQGTALLGAETARPY
jgi:murein DD-endopeptidase MepM/ murein hydrolase activator NlpD